MSVSSVTPSGAVSGVFPVLYYVQGSEQQTLSLNHSPYTVGRKVDRDLVIPDPRVSREHASLVAENGEFFVIDQGSKHGTFVNGERIDRRKLSRNDRLEFGTRDGAYLIFHPLHPSSNTAREFLSQISVMQISPETSDLEKLTLFLEAARKLNTMGVLDEILVTLIDATLRLTSAERGFIFLRDLEGKLTLAAGRNRKGEPLLDDKTISRSVLQEALTSNSEYLVTDTSTEMDMKERHSIVAFDLRTVICMPLRRPQVQAMRAEQPSGADVIGALYVDSRFAARDITGVSKDILRAIATEAAQLIENARLVQAEEAARRYQQELAIAASIQQQLMAVTIPKVPFAHLDQRNLPCKEIGGDFYDFVSTPEGLAIVLCDVSGKGVSAALLASTLQGMMYSHLVAGMPLTESVAAVNRYFTQKHIGGKYATMIVARLRPDGDLEYVNCGHVPPVWVCNHEVLRPGHGNLPVGLLGEATYESDHCQMKPGDRLILVTDGVTEAENASGEMFDSDRLEAVAGKSKSMDDIFTAITDFCGGTPLSDDCTVVELVFSGNE